MNTFIKEVILGNKSYCLVGLTQPGKGKTENQDSFSFYNDEECIIGVVADGLGSAIKAAAGAKAVCEATISVLKQDFLVENLSQEILITWKKTLNGNPLAYDTTLRFFKIHKNNVLVGGVGDGWTSILNGNSFISFEAKNKFANQTESMMSYDMKECFWIQRFEARDSILISIATDGYSEDIDKALAESYLAEVALSIQEPEKFLFKMQHLLQNWPVESNRDDKTVIFVKAFL